MQPSLPPRLSAARHDAHFRRLPFYMRHYTKKFATHAAQVALLNARGLSFYDEQEAVKTLGSVNYYRFTGYALPFTKDREHFLPNAVFEDVMSVCCFDAGLRDLLFEALEAIELDFRARFAYSFSQLYGSLGYRNPRNFKDAKAHADALVKIDKEIARSTEKCVAHFRLEYYQGEVPIWAVVEVMTFGTLASIYNNLCEAGAKAISQSYGIRWDILGSYLQHLSVLRNFCAHHSRLYDRKFYKFQPLKEWRGLSPAISDTRAFFYQVMLCYRLAKNVHSPCFDRDDWKGRLCSAFSTAPLQKCFDLPKLMGLPSDPANSPLWV